MIRGVSLALLPAVCAIIVVGCGQQGEQSTPPADYNAPAPAPPPPPPPPPRYSDCTIDHQTGAQNAIRSLGRRVEREFFSFSEYRSVSLTTCQFDSLESRVVARGTYAFIGLMNRDRFTFETSLSTDPAGSNVDYSTFVPDPDLDTQIRTKSSIMDFMNSVQQQNQNNQ